MNGRGVGQVGYRMLLDGGEWMGGEWDRWGIECCWMEGSGWEESGTGGV